MTSNSLASVWHPSMCFEEQGTYLSATSAVLRKHFRGCGAPESVEPGRNRHDCWRRRITADTPVRDRRM